MELDKSPSLKLSSYEYVVVFYRNLMEQYRWTLQQIDDTELEFLLDKMIVESKLANQNREEYIDNLI